MTLLVRRAVSEDLPAVKAIADRHRDELGFIHREAFEESVARGQLLVTLEEGEVLGFARFHHRRDSTTTLYEIAVSQSRRRAGAGRRLLGALYKECLQSGSRLVRLSCPVELPANSFYASVGFTRCDKGSLPGKKRPLYQWELLVVPWRPLRFVASITTSTNDLMHMVKLWEDEGTRVKPFEWCIVTPLFADPGALGWIRHIRARWGVRVMFDSGGFFVQQGKIAYEELFSRLLDFYQANDWADSYVLPDYVPTSRQNPNEVAERVHVTAAEGVKFFKRLPMDYRSRALGVMQGHTVGHLEHCFNAFMEAGIRNVGFGSFDTTGVNAEINLLTEDSLRRLVQVRRLLAEYYVSALADALPDLHLFGVSTPTAVRQFADFHATSFDSSGWLRTAGLGNIYLPFQARRNVSHGASALTIGRGLTGAQFYAECERSNHTCPFCADFGRLQQDRFRRMWHNALVFGEMTRALNCERLGRLPMDH